MSATYRDTPPMRPHRVLCTAVHKIRTARTAHLPIPCERSRFKSVVSQLTPNAPIARKGARRLAAPLASSSPPARLQLPLRLDEDVPSVLASGDGGGVPCDAPQRCAHGSGVVQVCLREGPLYGGRRLVRVRVRVRVRHRHRHRHRDRDRDRDRARVRARARANTIARARAWVWRPPPLGHGSVVWCSRCGARRAWCRCGGAASRSAAGRVGRW